MSLLSVRLRSAIRLKLALDPVVFAMAALTVMSPASVPAPAVLMVTLVPAFRLVAMSLAKMLDVAPGTYCTPAVAESPSV